MSAKILIFDLELSPALGYLWGLFDQTIAVNQIYRDWFVMSWAAKWRGEPRIFYQDQRNAKNIEDDKKILLELWKLLDAADVVITQNGIRFDEKKVNARFIIHGIAPPSPYRHIDTLRLAKKRFGFTSNKLEYLSDKLCPETKKDAHKEYPGFELWRACLAGDGRAWKEMERYNRQDVIATEAVFERLAPWGIGIDLNVYSEDTIVRCQCGVSNLQKRGFLHTGTGKFQRYQCMQCGAWRSSKVNLLSPEKKKSLRMP